MGERFEGVVCTQSADTVRSVVGQVATRIKLAIREMNPGIAVVFVTNPRSDGFFRDEMRELSICLSGKLGPVLLVAYDNQCGIRESELFDTGRHHVIWCG
jgi:hypothetical protein